jgi:hypothetical protein
MPALNVVTDFGAVPGTDCTLQFENAVAAARSEGRSLEVPPASEPYKLQHLDIPAIEMFGHLGTTIEHQAPDNNTDCIWITGEYERPTVLRDLTITAPPNVGRDLVSVRKGDHPLLSNVWMYNANRHGFKAIPHTKYYWIENMDLFKCKVINPKEESYAFEILDGGVDPVTGELLQPQRFINCTTLYGCESRLAKKQAIRLSVFETRDKNAKISSFNVIGGEYAVDYGLDPMIRLEAQTNPLGGFIENVSFLNTTIEYPGSVGQPSERPGHMMEVSGLMKGYLDFRASTWHGSPYFMKNFRNFPDYDVYDGIARRHYKSQQGMTDEFKSEVNVNPGYEEYTGVVCGAGEIIKGYVFERYNNDKVYAEFTAMNGKQIAVTFTHLMEVRLDNGQIVLKNLHSTSLKFEMVFQRIIVATPY